MERIAIPEELRRKLLAAEGTIEVTDESGIVFGEFRPRTDLSAFANDPDWPSDEELDRISRESPRYSVEEVMERLRKAHQMLVEWAEPALDRLAELYVGLNLDDQRTLARSVSGVNQRLADEAREIGESRGANHRVWFSNYLIVHFELTDDGVACVLTIRPNPVNWFKS